MFRFVVPIVLWLVAAGPAAAQGTPLGAPPDAQIVVVTDINFPPYLFRDEDGRVKGILKDKWALWSERNGVPVDLRGMDWSSAQQAVQSGEADVIEALSWREDRTRLYEYSRPYAPVEARVYFHRSISGINDVASMRGFQVGAKEGSACGNWLKDRGVENLRTFPTSEALVKAAGAEELRLFCMDSTAAQYYLYKLNLAGEFRQTPPLYSTQFHWAVKKGRPDLRAFIEKGFDRISARELEEIDERWLGNPLQFPIGTRYLYYVGGVLGAIIAIAALLFMWNRALRSRVAARTGELRTALQSVEEHVATERGLNEELGRRVAELHTSEERFRSLTEFYASYVWELDEEFRLTWIRGRGLDDLGLQPEKVIGARIDEMDVGYEFLSPTLGQYLEIRKRHEPYRDVRGKFTLPDGTERFVSVWGEPIFKADGTFAGYRGLTQDITDTVRLERALKQLNEQLEQRVAARTGELADANRELEAFAYSVSHDLRAPLRAIDRFAQMAISGSDGKVDENVTRSLQRVRAASQRMAQLINDLLSLSRVTRHELLWQQVDLSALANDVASELSSADPARHVALTICPAMTARADLNLVRILLDNLLGNAWKFTSGRDPASIEVGTEACNGETAYFVRDNGAGFDMQYADKLFRAFERLHSDQDFPGTGIGLAIVERIVKRHGGRIWAEAALEKGATFHFTLGKDA